jgi:predicted transcriptional regulator
MRGRRFLRGSGMSRKSVEFSVQLPNGLLREIDELATVGKRSRNWVIKHAVVAYLQEQKAYFAAIEEGLAEADKGIFISGERVPEWLASWGTENELPLPEPDIFPEPTSRTRRRGARGL